MIENKKLLLYSVYSLPFLISILVMLIGHNIAERIEYRIQHPKNIEIVRTFEGYRDNKYKQLFNIMALKQPFHIDADEYEEYDGLVYPVVYVGENMPLEIEYIKHQEMRMDYYRVIYCDNGKTFEVPYIKPLNPPGNYTLENKIVSGYMYIPEDVTTGVPCIQFMPTTFFNGEDRLPEYTAYTDKFIARRR